MPLRLITLGQQQQPIHPRAIPSGGKLVQRVGTRPHRVGVQQHHRACPQQWQSGAQATAGVKDGVLPRQRDVLALQVLGDLIASVVQVDHAARHARRGGDIQRIIQQSPPRHRNQRLGPITG